MLILNSPPVPFKEDDLWNGYPEETNASLPELQESPVGATLRLSAALCFNGIYLLPVNLYGPEDNFDTSSSHVIPALIRKVHEAQIKGHSELKVWGDGSPTREFFTRKMRRGGIVMGTSPITTLNLSTRGTGYEISIRNLISLICELMEFDGQIVYETDKPNGQLRRCLDTERAKLAFGFVAQVDFKQGMKIRLTGIGNTPPSD